MKRYNVQARYVDVELRQLKAEQDLSAEELSQIMRVDLRQVWHYIKGTRAMPDCRWRLLMLELGLARPYWTREKRTKRMVEEYTG